MRGRKPTPTFLKVLQGNPGRRPINHKEPEPKAASPHPPRGLYGEARKIWQHMAPELCRLGLVTELDCHHFARVCRLEALGMRMLRKAEKQPVTITKSNGEQPSGEFSAALRAFEAADRWWMRFGISPSERTRLKVTAAAEENSFLKFIARK